MKDIFTYCDAIFDNCNIIVDAMNSMKFFQREREREGGSKDGVYKYNTLLERYFKSEIKDTYESKDIEKNT